MVLLLAARRAYETTAILLDTLLLYAVLLPARACIVICHVVIFESKSRRVKITIEKVTPKKE